MASLRKTVKVPKIVLFGSGSSHWSYLWRQRPCLCPHHAWTAPCSCCCSSELQHTSSHVSPRVNNLWESAEETFCSRLYIWNKLLCFDPKQIWVAGSCRSRVRIFWASQRNLHSRCYCDNSKCLDLCVIWCFSTLTCRCSQNRECKSLVPVASERCGRVLGIKADGWASRDPQASRCQAVTTSRNYERKRWIDALMKVKLGSSKLSSADE